MSVFVFCLQFLLSHLTTLRNKGVDYIDILFWVHCNHAQSCNGYGQTDCFEISGIMSKSTILFYAYKVTVKFLFSGSRQSHRIFKMFDIDFEKYFINFKSELRDIVKFSRNLWQTSRQLCGSVEILGEKRNFTVILYTQKRMVLFHTIPDISKQSVYP